MIAPTQLYNFILTLIMCAVISEREAPAHVCARAADNFLLWINNNSKSINVRGLFMMDSSKDS